MSISIQHLATYVAVAVAVLVGAVFTLPQSASAAFDIPAGGVELEGFAWSAYTQGPTTSGIGWISMNCSNTGTCSTSDYKVELDTSGNLTGYAWSSTVGWISFDPAGPYPSGTGVLNEDAQVTSGSFIGNLNFGGWARVCAAAANPTTCSGGMNANAGGWDGWIALAGTAAGGYEITMTPAGAANGTSNYAWGGPVIAGWVDFSPDNGDLPVTYNNPPVPSVDLDCPAESVASTDVVCGYIVENVTNCSLGDDKGSPDRVISVTGTQLTVNPGDVDTVYTLTCNIASGPPIVDSETITVTPAPPAPNPVITITVPDIVRSGSVAEVEITVTSVGGSTCNLFGPGLTGTSFVVPIAESYTNTFPTAALVNSTSVAVECSVVNGTPFRQGGSIEVTAALQEV